MPTIFDPARPACEQGAHARCADADHTCPCRCHEVALANRAAGAIDATLHLRPRYGVSDAVRNDAATVLAALWGVSEGFGITRDDWRTVCDLPSTCLSLAGILARRVEIAADVAAAAAEGEVEQ
ncbi:hypothetical protein ABN034_09315 [Actinopolymorpha sp. B11F2]|uniref:hypothetical protein n=1 Tax=Actinopolymorpha sp. B11F2 TaxID=3160862 RepID=UPI0032E4A5EA